MKTLLILILFACAATTCWSQQTPPPRPVAADDSLYLAAARALAKEFGGALLNELQGALDENGPAYAVSVCQTKAPQIAAAHSGAGWTVKRVSEKWRNISGLPDSTEKAVLREFAAATDTVSFRTRWSGPDTARVFTYYQKIVMREMCLWCHGDIEQSDPELWKQIRVEYIADKATGYKVGDLRGMFVVSAHVPAAAASAKKLAEGTSMKEVVSGLSK
jgi:hypothetical protein